MKMISGGMSKARPDIQISFNSGIEKKKLEYEDTFPDDLPTIEDVKEKYGTVIWCKYTGCKDNKEVEGLQRTSGTVLKNMAYEPIFDQDHIWTGICTRKEVAIKFDEVRTAGAKVKVPSCFTASSKKSGHVDFSQFLQSDGSPLGGNIESQHVSDDGYGGLDSNNMYGE
tara:strand:+ start:417 stop:923 length:507 start_codon:yes stop_codon:yes gene_type:complete